MLLGFHVMKSRGESFFPVSHLRSVGRSLGVHQCINSYIYEYAISLDLPHKRYFPLISKAFSYFYQLFYLQTVSFEIFTLSFDRFRLPNFESSGEKNQIYGDLKMAV